MSLHRSGGGGARGAAPAGSGRLGQSISTWPSPSLGGSRSNTAFAAASLRALRRRPARSSNNGPIFTPCSDSTQSQFAYFSWNHCRACRRAASHGAGSKTAAAAGAAINNAAAATAQAFIDRSDRERLVRQVERFGDRLVADLAA